ncbi:MAG TPA: DUF5777 family beta-barrel protein [Prolixibacteraceae bacterium]|nr:DUF5777 family beta-barrel protein [Prolixibacteraceae bacterium]
MKKLTCIIIGLFLLCAHSYAQDLDSLMNESTNSKEQTVSATFKSTRIINGHSIEQMKPRQLEFRISHRFGTLNQGAYGLFGMDQSVIHFSLEYGLNNWLMAGVGRGSVNKTYDAFAKFHLLRQSSGDNSMPVHVSYLSSVELKTLKFPQRPDNAPNYFADRFTFVQQLMIARKFNENLSLQLSPTYIHRNLVTTELDQNDIFALGAGGRYKLTKRMSVNAEYYYTYQPNAKFLNPRTYNVMSVGVDIETGGHVFQLMLTNTQGMREGSFIPATTGSWKNGDIHLGFNISRVFAL